MPASGSAVTSLLCRSPPLLSVLIAAVACIDERALGVGHCAPPGGRGESYSGTRGGVASRPESAGNQTWTGSGCVAWDGRVSQHGVDSWTLTKIGAAGLAVSYMSGNYTGL